MLGIEDTCDSEEREFWISASDESLNAIWDNEEDDVYAELLEGYQGSRHRTRPRNNSIPEDVV